MSQWELKMDEKNDSIGGPIGSQVSKNSSPDVAIQIEAEKMLLNESDLEELSDKNRTPSGNIIQSSVQTIRTIFSPMKVPCSEQVLDTLYRKDENVCEQSTGTMAQHDYTGACLKQSRDESAKRNTQTSDSEVCDCNTSDSGDLISSDVRSASQYADRRVQPQRKAKVVKKRKLNSEFEKGVKNKHDQSSELSPADEDAIQHSTKTMKAATQQQIDEMLKKQKRKADQLKAKVKEKEVSRKDIAQFQQTTEEEMEFESNNEEDPKSLSVSSIYRMFLVLKKEMGEIRASLDTEAIKKDCAEGAVKAVREILSDDQLENQQLKASVEFYKQKTDILTEVIERMNTEIVDLTQKVENLEVASSKRMITISGLSLNIPKEMWCSEVKAFLEYELGIIVEIEEVFKIGKAEPKLLTVTLQSQADKRLILKNKSKLSKIQSDVPIYINEYFSMNVQEKKKREKDIRQQVGAAFEGSQNPPQISYTQGNITIQGEIYQKRVKPPTPKELIDLEPDELEKILKMQTTKGSVVTQERSKFIAYVASVSTHREVRDLYKKMKLAQPNARHIPCAYWLPGQSDFQHYNQDYHDDGESSAGRVLLDFLVQNNLKNRVVFVARRYGGIRMGMDRFECYVDAARSAFQLNAYNTVLGLNQQLNSDFKVDLRAPSLAPRPKTTGERRFKNDQVPGNNQPSDSSERPRAEAEPSLNPQTSAKLYADALAVDPYLVNRELNRQQHLNSIRGKTYTTQYSNAGSRSYGRYMSRDGRGRRGPRAYRGSRRGQYYT